jgi:hypothetical protein
MARLLWIVDDSILGNQHQKSSLQDVRGVTVMSHVHHIAPWAASVLSDYRRELAI